MVGGALCVWYKAPLTGWWAGLCVSGVLFQRDDIATDLCGLEVALLHV
jgi:hypothetical protein